MQTVTLKAFPHRGQQCLGLFFPSNTAIQRAVKKISGIRWSQTLKCWYLPLSKENHRIICLSIGSMATIDDTAIKTFLTIKPVPAVAAPTPATKKTTVPVKIVSAGWSKISPENAVALEQFTQQLQLKAYSTSTIRTYRNEFMQLLQLIKNKPVVSLTPDDLKRYLVYAMDKQGISENTAHSRLNAIKFYFEQVLKNEKFFWDIPRPKKQKQLPKVFSKNEVAAILNSVTNIKHKVMLMLAYSAGLRVSEVVHLKTAAVDSSRMTIFVESAKGKKDRMVTLSPVLLVMLREYAQAYKPNKKGYLFEGNTKNTPYNARSLQEVLYTAKKAAGVIKPGSIHSLRHSFATHLVEKGTDVTMIQKLLGHNDLKTTLIYLHTSNKDLLKIVSPLDDLDLT